MHCILKKLILDLIKNMSTVSTQLKSIIYLFEYKMIKKTKAVLQKVIIAEDVF